MTARLNSQDSGIMEGNSQISPTTPTKKFVSVKYVGTEDADSAVPVSSTTERKPDGTVIVTNVSQLPDGRTQTIIRKTATEDTERGTRTVTTVTKRITISKDIYNQRNSAELIVTPPEYTKPALEINGRPAQNAQPPTTKPPEPPIVKEEKPTTSSSPPTDNTDGGEEVKLRDTSEKSPDLIDRYRRFSSLLYSRRSQPEPQETGSFFGSTYVNESRPLDEQLDTYRKLNEEDRKKRRNEADEDEKERKGDTTRRRQRAKGGIPPWRSLSSEKSSFEEGTAHRWYNRAEEILKSELGPAEFQKRLDKQNKLFEDGCKKGSVFSGPAMYFSKGSVRSIFEKRTKAVSKRATHSVGVGALGYAVVDMDERLPENDFFTPERVFEIRARHSNFPQANNDAQIGNRSLAVKFADHDYEAPIDFIFQTGYLSPYFNLDSIEALHNALMKGSHEMKAYFTSLPVYLEAALEGMRQLPDSYYHQHYHSQMVYDFKARDDVRRVARFRIIPMDHGPETGRLDPDAQREAWFSLLLEQDEHTKSKTYLRDEFRHRLSNDCLEYKLQVQLHEWEKTDTNIWYNASIPWDSETHPWINVATLCLTGVLPDDVTEVTRFNIGQLPKEVISFPAATSNADFNVVPNLRAEIYGQVARLRPKEVKEAAPGENVEYLIHTVTGSHQLAGNLDQNCNVFVSIIGTDGRTPFIKLDRRLRNDFDRGNKAAFSVKAHRVGDFQCAKVFKERRGPKSDWFLEYMVITTPYNNKCHTMPCYRWLSDTVPLLTLREGVGVIDNLEGDHYLRLLRNQEVVNRQRVFQWRDEEEDEDFGGLPGYCFAGDNIDQLPTDMISEDMKKLILEWDKHVNGKNSMIKTFLNFFKSKRISITEEYERSVADAVAKKDEAYANLEQLLRNWRNEDDFARQLLNGVNPNMIKKLRKLPSNFRLTDAMVRGSLEEGCTLQTELQAGRLFLIEYPELEEFADNSPPADEEGFVEETDGYARSFDIPQHDSATLARLDEKERKKVEDQRRKEEEKRRKEEEKRRKEKEKAKKKMHLSERRKYLCAPMVILYLKGNTLLPLAIQLSTNPSPGEDLIFTKRDDTNKFSDWLVAKMWVKVADANYQQVVSHVFETHLIMEPVAIAAARQLPSVHPVFKILYTHLRKLVSVNTIYRKRVLHRSGALAEVLALGDRARNNHVELMKKKLNNFSFNSLNLPDNLSNREVLEQSSLPGYHYRDDALSLWEAIRDYVTETLSIYYDTDDDVMKDDELAELLKDLKENGYHNKVDLPARFPNIEELVKFCTIVIFRCSVQHAAVTNGMLDIYGYCPNAPPCMMKPYPETKRGERGYTEEEVKAMLPPSDIAERYIGLVLLMFGGLEPPAIPLGVFKEQLFTEERALIARKHLDDRLKTVTKRIERRNESCRIPYNYLLPSNISTSISD